jgi:hypothetical protein
VFSEDFDSEWPDGGHLGGWPPMGLKPADAVFYHQRAPLQKVNKARRQRFPLFFGKKMIFFEIFFEIFWDFFP